MVSSKEDERSLFVSGIVKNKDKYLFLVKNPEQWQQDENGRLRHGRKPGCQRGNGRKRPDARV